MSLNSPETGPRIIPFLEAPIGSVRSKDQLDEVLLAMNGKIPTGQQAGDIAVALPRGTIDPRLTAEIVAEFGHLRSDTLTAAMPHTHQNPVAILAPSATRVSTVLFNLRRVMGQLSYMLLRPKYADMLLQGRLLYGMIRSVRAAALSGVRQEMDSALLTASLIAVDERHEPHHTFIRELQEHSGSFITELEWLDVEAAIVTGCHARDIRQSRSRVAGEDIISLGL